MRTLFIVFLFGVFCNVGYSQPKTSILDIRNVYDEKGDYYFGKKEYKKAIVYYNMAYKKDANNYYSVLRKAEAYTSSGLYDQAAECYRIIFNTDLYIPNEYRLQYALLLLKNRDITGFEREMKVYNEIVRSEIHDYLSSTEVRAKMYKDTSFVIVENENVVNTPESEIGPAVYKNRLVFASTRKNLTGDAGSGYYNIFSASYLDDGHLGKLNLYNTSLNSAQNESAIAFSPNTNSMYITWGASVNSKLKTFVSDIPASIHDRLETKEFSIEGFGNIGQVALNSKGTTLYFVSDAPGGSGGLDIYSSDLIGSRWSRPRNLGPAINSNKDEVYPFVLNDTLLFFASAGHDGFGGFDLYSVNLKRENSVPKNLGSTVNSEYDEYGLSFSPGGYTGYFCSNRPGGFGKEDIYRVHLMGIKVKLPAYRFRKKSFMEDDKINLYLSNGDEYNIASVDKTGFGFGFQPEEAYKMVIQHENPLASNIIYNDKLSADRREKAFLNPEPFQRTEIRLQTGMRYQFTAGLKPISDEYKKALNELSKEYQNTNSSAIDLTALAKELFMNEGEIYTIRFVKDESRYPVNKPAGESSLFINGRTIPVSGVSFFIVLPLDIQSNFNIETDIAHLKETFNPKKTGTVIVDAAPVYKEEPVKMSEGFPILVNTESFGDIIPGKEILATELSIVPGTMYILTFDRTDAGAQDLGVIIPLTKGVKYNLGTEAQSKNDYNKALAQMTAAQAGNENPDEELIDISVLSKELDIASERDIVFNLIPVRQIASQTSDTRNILTTLSVDGRKYYVTNRVKMQINLKLQQDQKVNIQTDLAYVQENFDPDTIAVKVDTTSINHDLKEVKKSIITDPVFDLITVNFNLNDYSIRPDAKSILVDKVVQVLKSDSRLYVTIKGYTDPIGDEAYNEILSKNRALAVKDFLKNNGIGENRIRTFSYGESLALKAGERWEDLSESQLAKLRKVEIVIYLPK
jgi:outer membrane protein OmpA-like peptidoglycan-associated protein/tetratricopeptide (TPR) repeat protein